MTPFEAQTAVEKIAEDRYSATVDPAWRVARGAHGGYIAAIILRSLTDTIGDAERPIRSFTTHFLAAPKEGVIEVTTRVERTGRSMTFASARVEQDSHLVGLSLAAFS